MLSVANVHDFQQLLILPHMSVLVTRDFTVPKARALMSLVLLRPQPHVTSPLRSTNHVSTYRGWRPRVVVTATTSFTRFNVSHAPANQEPTVKSALRTL